MTHPEPVFEPSSLELFTDDVDVAPRPEGTWPVAAAIEPGPESVRRVRDVLADGLRQGPTGPAWAAAVTTRAVGLASGPVGAFLARYTNAYSVPATATDAQISGAVILGGLLWLAGGLIAKSTGVPTPAWFLLGLVLFVVWAGSAAAVVAWWLTYRLSPARLRHQLLARPGTARAREIAATVGDRATRAKVATVRPSLAGEDPAPEQVAWLLGSSRDEPVWVNAERPAYVVGPARSGKGFRVLTTALIESVGAVVSTSTRADAMEMTIGARAARGPVFVFDPEGVTGRKTTLRWSPLTGCENAMVAQRRAQALVARTGMGGDNAIWAQSAGHIVQALLHAAAIGGRTIHDVWRWSKSPERAANEAGKILAAKSPENWGLTLESILGEDPRLKGSKWLGVEAAFQALEVSQVRDLFDVDPASPDAFDAAAFLRETGTLYAVSRWRDHQSTGASVGGFLSMLLDHIAETARDLSQTSPGGRLDPPATFVLDEIANIHPWPSLPRAFAAGSGEGLQVIAVFQSRTQARDAYSADLEASMWDSALRIVLGGSASESDLSALSKILGVYEAPNLRRSWQAGQITGRTHSEDVTRLPLFSEDELRRLPETVALLVDARTRAIVVDLVEWTRRPWADQVNDSLAWHQTNPATPGHLVPPYPGSAS